MSDHIVLPSIQSKSAPLPSLSFASRRAEDARDEGLLLGGCTCNYCTKTRQGMDGGTSPYYCPMSPCMTADEEAALAKELQSVVGEGSSVEWADSQMMCERVPCAYSPTGPSYLRLDVAIRPPDLSGLITSEQPQSPVPSTPPASKGIHRARAQLLPPLAADEINEYDGFPLFDWRRPSIPRDCPFFGDWRKESHVAKLGPAPSLLCMEGMPPIVPTGPGAPLVSVAPDLAVLMEAQCNVDPPLPVAPGPAVGTELSAFEPFPLGAAPALRPKRTRRDSGGNMAPTGGVGRDPLRRRVWRAAMPSVALAQSLGAPVPTGITGIEFLSARFLDQGNTCIVYHVRGGSKSGPFDGLYFGSDLLGVYPDGFVHDGVMSAQLGLLTCLCMAPNLGARLPVDHMVVFDAALPFKRNHLTPAEMRHNRVACASTHLYTGRIQRM